jgi:hypothetical protein
MLQEAEAAKEVAEQRFWLPLERSKGRRMGELCVSLLFTKVSCLCEEVKHTLMASCCTYSDRMFVVYDFAVKVA